MPIQTVFAQVSCTSLAVSDGWFQKLFGKPATRRPMAGLLEWQLTDSAEIQLFESPANADHSVLTLGVLPLGAEVERLRAAGLPVGPIEQASHFFIMRMRDPDQNLIVLASADK